jgi:hypothetical protein
MGLEFVPLRSKKEATNLDSFSSLVNDFGPVAFQGWELQKALFIYKVLVL